MSRTTPDGSPFTCSFPFSILVPSEHYWTGTVLVSTSLNYYYCFWSSSTGVTALKHSAYCNAAQCDKGWSLDLVSGILVFINNTSDVGNQYSNIHIHTFSSKCNSIFSCWIWGRRTDRASLLLNSIVVFGVNKVVYSCSQVFVPTLIIIHFLHRAVHCLVQFLAVPPVFYFCPGRSTTEPE